VGENETVHEVVRLLIENRISAVPVVNDAGRLVGIVTEADPYAPARSRNRTPPFLVVAASLGRPQACGGLREVPFSKGEGYYDPRRQNGLS
jgi:hypothetical protein